MQHINFQSSNFKIQYPSSISQIIVLSIVLVILTTVLMRIIHDDYSTLSLFYLLGIQILFYFILLIVVIYRRLMKPTVLNIHEESIFINGRTVEAKQVKMIMVMGYFNPILGIRPINKRNVPIHLCFRFNEDEDKGMKGLKSWAELNQIPFVHKRFGRGV